MSLEFFGRPFSSYTQKVLIALWADGTGFNFAYQVRASAKAWRGSSPRCTTRRPAGSPAPPLKSMAARTS